MLKFEKFIWLILIVTITLFLLSIILQFQLASAGFIVSAIMNLEYIFATKDVRANNPLKIYYKNKGNIAKYRRICIVMCVIFFVIGLVGFLIGLSKI